MRKYLPKSKRKRWNQGFTLLEILVVIAILGVVSLIAIPSVASLGKSLNAAQSDEYAKTIFIAAQANLSKMRSEGTLSQLQPDADGNLPGGSEYVLGNSGFPAAAPGAGAYAYITSTDADAAIYDLVLPPDSLEDIVRDQQVIIEYSPFTGNVYAVFYSEDSSIFGSYIGNGLPREDDETRKEMQLGYYQGSFTTEGTLEKAQSNVTLSSRNGQDFTVTVTVALPNYMSYHDPLAFRAGLSVSLTVIGESGGSFVLELMDHGSAPSFVGVDASNSSEVKLTVALDTDDTTHGHRRFANYAAGNHTQTAQALLESENAFLNKIKPGDNVAIIASVNLDPLGEIPDATFSSEHNIGCVNPMFETLTLVSEPDKEDFYLLEIAADTQPRQDRHAENLSLIHNSIADILGTVRSQSSVYWDQDDGVLFPDVNWDEILNNPSEETPDAEGGA